VSVWIALAGVSFCKNQQKNKTKRKNINKVCHFFFWFCSLAISIFVFAFADEHCGLGHLFKTKRRLLSCFVVPTLCEQNLMFFFHLLLVFFVVLFCLL